MSKLFRTAPVTTLEHARQGRVVRYLVTRGWQVKETEGTIRSYGWPDLYAAHLEYGPRWIEMKTPSGKLRETQIDFITQFQLVGVGVWVLVEASPIEYAKLFSEPNWRYYLPLS